MRVLLRGLSIDNDVIDTHFIGTTLIGRLCLSSLFHLIIFRDGLDVNKELRQGQVGELLDFISNSSREADMKFYPHLQGRINDGSAGPRGKC